QVGLYQPVLAISMFAPFAATIISCKEWKKVGFVPRMKGNAGWLFYAWSVPAVLGTLGAAIYFLLFPKALDMGFGAIYALLGEAGIAQLQAGGLSLNLYIAINIVSSVTFAPWINMFFAVGEEVGWRGYMYPILKERFGTVKGRILGGVIWGIWHWPIMILTGYEYGKEYWGAPVMGPIVFCIITIAMGIILDESYEKTKCIWFPALMHGAINAFAGIPTLFMNAQFHNEPLLGPLMVGLIGGLPMILLAGFISLKRQK
ncbi:MAG: CPBP family intramembrane metalloprotease, partial [Clostridiales bacterium]|nr:CPBP family intramembrane metalloprotease [Clostridiales bacterium]